LKHLITSCCVLVLAVLLPPMSEAAPRCMHLTNFCDTILFDTSGPLIFGNWDWECQADYKTSSIIGQTRVGPELSTRPYDYEQYLWHYAFEFSFKPGKLFDLHGTAGVVEFLGGLITFQTDQPYAVTNGPCVASDVDTRKPRMVRSSRPRILPSQHGQEVDRCIHFTNFCDTIVFATSGGFAYGNWDWNCTKDWVRTPIIGNAKVGRELATRPGFSYGYTFPYSTQFSPKPGRLFDLYLTNGAGGKVFTGRKDEPYTISDGVCSADDVNTLKPRTLFR
jgi:hypothetical protein